MSECRLRFSAHVHAHAHDMYQVIGDKETPAEACRVTYSHLGSHARCTEPLLTHRGATPPPGRRGRRFTKGWRIGGGGGGVTPPTLGPRSGKFWGFLGSRCAIS